MPSYSSDLRITLIDSGTQAGTWGDTTNATWQYVVDPAITGFQTVSVTTANQALTHVNGATATASLNQAIYASLAFTTTTAAAFNVYAPPNSKQYVLWNNSSYTMTIYNSTVIGNTTAAGIGVSIAAGKKVPVFSDGTNFYTLNINEIFAADGVLYADSTGAVTSSPTLLSFNAAASVLDVSYPSNGQAYVRAINSTVGTGAGGALLAQADKAVGNLRAFSSGVTTFAANQTLLYGSGTGAGGTIVADFSSGTGSTNQLRFMVGTTSVPITAATVNSSGNWNFNGKTLTAGNLTVTDTAVPANGAYLYAADSLAFSTASGQVAYFTASNTSQGGSFSVSDYGGVGVTGMRSISVSNPNTGTGAYAAVRATSATALAQVSAFPSTYTSATFAGKSVFAGFNAGSASGTIFGDFSTGTNQIQFLVGTTGSPTTAATVDSSGNWDFNGKALTAGNLTVTSTTVPANGMYLYSTNRIGFSTDSGSVAYFTGANESQGGSLIVSDATGTGVTGLRSVSVSNANTGTGAYVALRATSATALAQVSAFPSTYTAATFAGKSVFAGFDVGSASGTIVGDFSTGTNQIQFLVGTVGAPTTAATVNSSGTWTYPKTPSFFTYLSTTQLNTVGTTATVYTVPFDVEVFDRTNNVSAGVFTAPVTGIYRFSAQVVVASLGSTGSASGALVSRLVTTSQSYLFGYMTPDGPTGTNYFGSFQSVGGSVAVPMTAGDTAYITVQAAGGTADTAQVRGASGAYYTWFSGELVA